MATLSTIFVALLDEGVDVWRPVDAEKVADGMFRIVSENPDPDEHWEFPHGALVRCEWKQLEGRVSLVAVALAQATA